AHFSQRLHQKIHILVSIVLKSLMESWQRRAHTTKMDGKEPIASSEFLNHGGSVLTHGAASFQPGAQAQAKSPVLAALCNHILRMFVARIVNEDLGHS